MVRECERFPVNDFIESVLGFPRSNVELYIDSRNAKKILSFLEKRKNRKKFKRILSTVFSLTYNDRLYRKEAVSKKAKNITAMKFTDNNERIYCKEYSIIENNREKKVVMIALYQKKGQMSKANKQFIDNLGGYNYGF